METEIIKCRQCGKTLLKYSKAHFRKYKSPIKNCPKCGHRYADPRCHEIAIEGIPGDTYSVGAYAILIIIGAFLLYRGIVLFNRQQLGVPEAFQWFLPSVFTVMGVILLVGGIVEIISILTGLKKKRFERLRRESEERLKDKNYAYLLKQMGYDVPEEYL